MTSHVNLDRLGAFAVVCITATACVACGSHTVSSPGPSSRAAARRPPVRAVPRDRRHCSRCRRAVDGRRVGAAKSDRSDAIIATLTTRAAGATTTSCRPTSRSRSSTRTATLRGWKWWGPRTTAVAARTATVFRRRCRCPRTPISKGRRIFPVIISGDTEGQGDCHLLVAERDEQKLYELYQANKAGDSIDRHRDVHLGPEQVVPGQSAWRPVHQCGRRRFPIAALTPTADEVASGAVNHALRFILPNDRMKADVYVHPATHAGGPESTEARRAALRRPVSVEVRLRRIGLHRFRRR